MSIAQKLQKILDSKAAIKTAIAGKGGTITDATPLDEYAQAVQSIPSGDDSALKGVIEGSATSVDIPQGTTKIKQNVFSFNYDLANVTIPNTVTIIENSAFDNCKGLTSITIPNSVTTIGVQAFRTCILLQEVIIPSSVTSLGNYAFSNCTRITNVTIPNSVITIGHQAFSYCASLTEIEFPDSVTTLGEYCVAQCPGLTKITIGTGISTIGNGFGNSANINLIIVKATTPPTIGSLFVTSHFNGHIYVPDASVNDYKTASNWSAYASYIYPLSEYQP